jgi:hypothetical protein
MGSHYGQSERKGRCQGIAADLPDLSLPEISTYQEDTLSRSEQVQTAYLRGEQALTVSHHKLPTNSTAGNSK